MRGFFSRIGSPKGNALFLILIAVALFAALSYAITQSSRSGSGGITKEQAQLDAALAEQCAGYVERGVNMLQLVGGCSAAQVSYELPSGTNENPLNPSNKACFLFDALGAGLTPCGPYLTAGCSAAVLSALAVGDVGCGNVVYAGMSSGNRIYTTLADNGASGWNNTISGGGVTPAASVTDGLANTDTLVGLADAGAPYQGALSCRGLGSEWYLPSKNELNLLYSARNAGALSGTFSPEEYWSSSDYNWPDSWIINFSTGVSNNRPKYAVYRIRCVRR